MMEEKVTLTHLLFGKGPIPDPSVPKITTEKLKDLAEGFKAFNVLGEEVKKAMGDKDEKKATPTSPSESIKGMRETITEVRELVKAVSEEKVEKKERSKWTVLPNGNIVPDPDGEFDKLAEALVAASNLKTGEKQPAYYYHDPETEEFKEAKGPVLIHQPTPPENWVVEDGKARKLQPGEPVVIKPTPAASAPSPKTWLVRPDGEVEEYEPGKPIVIKPQQPSQQFPTVLSQIADASGNPMGTPIMLPWPQLIEYTKAVQGIKQADEKHKAWMDFLGEMKQEIPMVLRGVVRGGGLGGGKAAEQKLTSGGGLSAEMAQQAREMEIRQCQFCQFVFATPKGVAEVFCPNPKCPSNQAQQPQPAPQEK